MKTLYFFIKAPNFENIKLLKRLVDKDDAVVFIQDGVYAIKHAMEFNCLKYVLKADKLSRNVGGYIQIIDYSELVELIFNYNKVVTI